MKTYDNKIDYIKIMLALCVTVIALAVRLPSAFLVADSEEVEDAYTDDTGLPYFTDPDSYYHVRIVDTMLRTGRIADTMSVDGKPWDTHSFYPEGRSAVYEPGIVYLTIALWKIFNLSTPIDISRVEFYLSGVMAMFTALVAYITGCRINGKICGFVAGILTGCAPEFVLRTSFGRFDTDIFVVLMNTLLISFLTEMLRKNEPQKQISLAVFFFLTAIIYANCWATRFSMLFAGLTIIGGLLYVSISTWGNSNGLGIKKRLVLLFTKRETIFLIGIGILILLTIGITKGFDIVGDIFSSLFFNMKQEVSDGVLPNMFESISELEKPAIVPDLFADWFRGYVIGATSTVVTGVGGAFAVGAAIGGFVLLGLHSFGILDECQCGLLKKNESLVYFVILGLWTVTGVYLTRSGVRFIEMLTVPSGLLAGIFAGWLPRLFKFNSKKWRIVGVVTTTIVVSSIVIPDMEGLFLSVRSPSVTDASANAMKWIKKNADDPEAVIESWWDLGYYYESESKHPCLWDGGTQDAARAILFSRAMVENDMEMSCRILYMLACSGNEPIDLLIMHTDPKTAFETLWEVLPMNTEDSCTVISDKCDMNVQDARKVESLIHPKESKEVYLVLSYMMISQTTMYEYYSDWDFTGTKVSPFKSDYPENQGILTEDEQKKLDAVRDGYTMWRLYFDVEKNPYFDSVYECYDGVEGVRVWRISSLFPERYK